MDLGSHFYVPPLLSVGAILPGFGLFVIFSLTTRRNGLCQHFAQIWTISDFDPVLSNGDTREGKGYVPVFPTFGSLQILFPC